MKAKSGEIKLGRCDFCEKPGVAIVGRLKADPDQFVCAVCLADPRVEAEPLPRGEVLACPCGLRFTIGDAVVGHPVETSMRQMFRDHGEMCRLAQRGIAAIGELGRRVSLWPRERNAP